MSADACVAFYGLRFEIPSDDIEQVERRSDPRMQAARKAGLKCYWDNFAAPNERYLLLIGTKIGVFGPENSDEVHLSLPELQAIFESTKAKLETAGLSGEPLLHIQWLPDA